MRNLLVLVLVASAPIRAGAETLVPSEPLQGVAEVGVGIGFSCARTEAGAVFCWGESKQGHLGRAEEAHLPVEISLPSPARRLWVHGDFPVCVELARDGSLWCWGRGQPTPVVQRGLEQSLGIVALYRSFVMRCALLRDGSVRCAGHRTVAPNGFSPTTGMEVAGRPYEAISELREAVQLGLGSEFACARTRAGAVRCWGRNNLGQLGTGGPARPSVVPVVPRGLDRDVQDLAVFGDAACVIVAGGAVRCWGETGMETPIRFGSTPTALRLPARARSLHAWINGLLALLDDGTLATWGYTELGDGKSQYVRRPTRISGLAGATQVTGGNAHYAATPAGWLCWGDCVSWFDPSPVGPIALPAEASPPVRDPATAVTCAVLDGQALCRGPNNKGQLGDGSTIDRRTEWRAVQAPRRRIP